MMKRLAICSLIPLASLALKAPLKQDSQIVRCDPKKRPEICNEIYAPVLGFTEDGDFHKFGNGCTACADESVAYYYLLNECANDSNNWEFNRKGQCPVTTAVCALTKDNKLENFNNGCKACADKDVDSHFRGSCPANAGEYFETCGANRGSNIRCTKEYNPVCGVKENGKEQTYSNGCMACASGDVLRWTQGECPKDNADKHKNHHRRRKNGGKKHGGKKNDDKKDKKDKKDKGHRDHSDSSDSSDGFDLKLIKIN